MENIRGAILMTIAMAGFALEDMFIKLASENGMPTGQVLIILGALGTMAYWAFMLPKGIRLLSPKLIEKGVVIRNIGEFIGTGAYVLAFTSGALAATSSVMQALPLFVTMGAALFLGAKGRLAALDRDWRGLFRGSPRDPAREFELRSAADPRVYRCSRHGDARCDHTSAQGAPAFAPACRLGVFDHRSLGLVHSALFGRELRPSDGSAMGLHRCGRSDRHGRVLSFDHGLAAW